MNPAISQKKIPKFASGHIYGPRPCPKIDQKIKNLILRSVGTDLKGFLGTKKKEKKEAYWAHLNTKNFSSNEHVILELSAFPLLHAKHFVKNVYLYCSFFNLHSQMYLQKSVFSSWFYQNWFQMNLIQPDDITEENVFARGLIWARPKIHLEIICNFVS